MGYRSDVMAVFYTRDKFGDENKEANERNRAKLKLFVEENFPAFWRGSDNSDWEDCLTLLEKPNRLIYRFKVESVKWYDSYPEIIAFEQFWDRFNELAEGSEEGDDPCRWAADFIRLGENTDDIEERCVGDSEWLIQVNRHIVTNY